MHDRLAAAGELLVAQAALSAIAAVWRRPPSTAPVGLGWPGAFTGQVLAALAASTLLSLTLWHAETALPSLRIAVAVWIALAAIAGAAIRLGALSSAVYAAPVAAAVLGVVFASGAGVSLKTNQTPALLFVLILGLAAPALGFGRKLAAGRTAMVGAGAIGAALLANWVWLWPGPLPAVLIWMLPAATTASDLASSASQIQETIDRGMTFKTSDVEYQVTGQRMVDLLNLQYTNSGTWTVSLDQSKMAPILADARDLHQLRRDRAN